MRPDRGNLGGVAVFAGLMDGRPLDVAVMAVGRGADCESIGQAQILTSPTRFPAGTGR
jgi:hypothetical protein